MLQAVEDAQITRDEKRNELRRQRDLLRSDAAVEAQAVVVEAQAVEDLMEVDPAGQEEAIAVRLEVLRGLRERGLLGEEEYQERRKALLDASVY